MFICRDMLHIPQIVWAGPDQPSKVTAISTFWNAQASEVNYLQIFFFFFILFGFCCMPFYRIHPWSVVLLLIVYFIEFCRYWTNPDKINSVEHLGQMENSLRDSLNHLRMHKVSLSFLWLGPSKEVLYLPYCLMKTIGDWN